MSRTEIAKVDSKGRLQLPSSLREFLNLKPGSDVLLSLDEPGQRLILTPSSEKALVSIRIAIGDSPGSLAKMAQVLASSGGDLVSSQSRSLSRGRAAEWQVVCSANSVSDHAKLKKKFISAGALSVSFSKL